MYCNENAKLASKLGIAHETGPVETKDTWAAAWAGAQALTGRCTLAQAGAAAPTRPRASTGTWAHARTDTGACGETYR